MSDLIPLEKYAELCSAMTETAGDELKEIEIASTNGVSEEEWKAAKTDYTAKMSDPKDMGKTALAFMPLYQAAQEKLRGGGPPGSLEDYTKVHAEMAYMKDPNDSDKQIDFMIVLENHGFSHSKWLEMEGYWTPRVATPENPKFNAEDATKFRELMQKEVDRIMGIER